MWHITHIIVLVILNILIFYWWYMNLSLIFQLQVGTLISCQVPRSSLTIITAKEKRKWIETHPGGHQIFKSPENVSFFASHVFVIDYNSYNYHRPYILIMSCPIQKHSTVSINVFSQGRLTLDIRVTPYGCQPSLMWCPIFFSQLVLRAGLNGVHFSLNLFVNQSLVDGFNMFQHVSTCFNTFHNRAEISLKFRWKKYASWKM